MKNPEKNTQDIHTEELVSIDAGLHGDDGGCIVGPFKIPTGGF